MREERTTLTATINGTRLVIASRRIRHNPSEGEAFVHEQYSVDALFAGKHVQYAHHVLQYHDRRVEGMTMHKRVNDLYHTIAQIANASPTHLAEHGDLHTSRVMSLRRQLVLIHRPVIYR